MTDFTIDAKGLKALRKKLRQLGDDLGDFKEAHKAAAKLIELEAKRRAPVGTGKGAGAAKRSTKGQGSKTRALVVAGTTTKAKNYAARQHWSQQRGRPGFQWVYKAVGKTGWDVVDIYHDLVDKSIKKMNRSGFRDAF